MGVGVGARAGEGEGGRKGEEACCASQVLCAGYKITTTAGYSAYTCKATQN